MSELIVMMLILLPLGLYFVFYRMAYLEKEQLTLIHDYHYTGVARKDNKSYIEKI